MPVDSEGVTVFRVRLSPKVEEAIEEEIFQTACDSPDDVGETGGWLWSPAGVGWWGLDGIDVQEASGPGLDATKAYGALTLSTDYLIDLDALFRADGLELCGGWHLHPSANDMPNSDEDLQRIAYVLNLRRVWGCRTQRALEIVITRHPEGGWRWVATPWVFYKGPGGITGAEGVWPEPTVLVKGD